MTEPESGRAHRYSDSPPTRIDRLERALRLDGATYRTRKQAALFSAFWIALIAVQVFANATAGGYQPPFPAVVLLYLGFAIIGFEEWVYSGRSGLWKVMRILGFLVLPFSSLAVASSTGSAIAGTGGAMVAVLGTVALCAAIFVLGRGR